jgi:hypothetical protein
VPQGIRVRVPALAVGFLNETHERSGSPKTRHFRPLSDLAIASRSVTGQTLKSTHGAPRRPAVVYPRRHPLPPRRQSGKSRCPGRRPAGVPDTARPPLAASHCPAWASGRCPRCPDLLPSFPPRRTREPWCCGTATVAGLWPTCRPPTVWEIQCGVPPGRTANGIHGKWLQCA